MLRALAEYVVEGPATLIPFHRWLLSQDEFIAGGACHALLAELAENPTPIPDVDAAPAPPGDPAPDEAEETARRFTAEVGGRRFEVVLHYADGAVPAGAAPAAPAKKPKRARSSAAAAGSADEVVTPMQGTVLRIAVEVGQEVSAGDLVCIVEAMKMENEVTAHRAGTVQELRVAEGQSTQPGDVVAVIR